MMYNKLGYDLLYYKFLMIYGNEYFRDFLLLNNLCELY